MWKINDLGYFEAPGLSVLVFHNTYPEGKQGGIEIIQHGERVATNGDLRLEPTPGQWAPLPHAGEREVDREKVEVRVPLHYPDLELDCVLRVWAEEAALRVAVDLANPLPPEWADRLSLNLELFPGTYFGKTFHLGDTWGVFPRQPNGPVAETPLRGLQPLPMATGSRLVVAPEDPLCRIAVERADGEIALFDGRNTAQNGWFVVRSLVPAGATTDAITWTVTPNTVPGWQRDPVICISQVGYHPDQVKCAIIELDPRTEQPTEASLSRIAPEGGEEVVLSAQPERWGRFLCYEYAIFDFTAIQDAGMYVVRYGNKATLPFKIARDVYQDVWQPTLETFLPVQMCHVEVRDQYRVWHGVCHLDDALQAPAPHKHFDGYQQGPETDTPYAPYTHIPELDRGGWHDAGDYDLAAGSQAQTTFALVLVRETFGVDTDQTTVQQGERLVLLHTPDGVPDIVQQIAHGAESMLSGYHAVGHSFMGIIAGTLAQYVHLGDASTMTDNLIYDPTLGPDEVIGQRSGRMDDRWVFTNRDTSLEYQVAAALAAASRVLRGYEDALAEECLTTALRVWEYEQAHEPVEHRSAYVPRHFRAQEGLTAIELLITTGEARFHQRLLDLWPEMQEGIPWIGWALARALPWVNDEAFARDLRELIRDSKERLDEEIAKNPFGIPYHPNTWGIGWGLQYYALSQYFLIRAFPDLFDRENVLRVLNYVLGCHPGSNTSLVSGVGGRSVTAAYGVNRADWSYIPGGVVSGPNLIRPDFPELKSVFPFLWQQTEYVIGGAATYIFCVLAADALLNEDQS